MKKHLLTVLTITMFGIVNAQTTHFSILGPPDTEGTLYYSNIGAVKRPDGSFVTVERSPANGFFIRTFSSSGTIVSTSKISGSVCTISTVSGVTAMGANGLLVTGMGTTSSSYVYYVAKIDLSSHMAIVTTKPVISTAYTAGPKVSTDGSSVFALYPSYDRYDINKYDAGLTPLWSKTCEVDTTTGKNPGMDCEMTDSTIVVVGKCDSYMGMGTFSNTTGDLNAFKIYYAGYNRMYGMTKTADGNFLVAGMHSNTYAGTGSPLVAKLAPNGTVLWVKILNMYAAGSDFGRLIDVMELPDGKIAAFGTSFDAYSDTFIDGVCMLDNTGNFLWSKKFNDSNGTNRFYDVKVYDNGILMAGLHSEAGASSMVVAFTDFSFTEVCNTAGATLTCDPYTLGTMADVSPSQAHYSEGVLSTTATMGTLTPAGDDSFSTCALTLGLNESQQQEFSVYPNPATAGSAVTVQMQNAGTYRVVITDVSGQQVATQTASSNNIVINTSGLSTGVYMVSVLENNYPVAIQKLMIR